MEFFPDPCLYIVLCLCDHIESRIWSVLGEGGGNSSSAVQAEGPGWAGAAGGAERGPHMHSNSSMRCLVFPERICRRVLYLSRPAFMFSAWIMSLTVFLVSSRALASSELRACGQRNVRDQCLKSINNIYTSTTIHQKICLDQATNRSRL